jgi:K+-transporting ATPase ATPase C chain
MNETTSKNGFAGGLRQAVSVTLMFLFLCGFLFPVVLSGLSAVMFPDQAKGSLVTADGEVVGAANVGQDFTEPYFMKCRPSACHYNTYYEDAEGNRFYNDGSEFAGLSSGSNNYGPSNPALVERVEADIEEFLTANPDVTREELPADLMTASGSGLDPHVSPEGAQIQIPALAEASGLSEEELEQIVADNTTGKLLGIVGEEAVNVLGVNLDIAAAMGLVGEVSK